MHHRPTILSPLLWGALTLLLPPALLGGPVLPESQDPALQARPLPSAAGSFLIGDTEVRLPPGAEPAHLRAVGRGWILGSVVRNERGSAIHLLLEDAVGELRSLPVPEARRGSEIRDPLPLTDAENALRGLVWLEGPDRGSLALRQATWDGYSWTQPRTLAAPGPGSQLALDAVPLPDGSHLLVWSRFDGEDDEIVWLRTEVGEPDGGHTGDPEIRAVHAGNAVPDITPALLSAPGGALLAWSRYDGNDYRLQLARFSSGEWILLGPLPDRGAVFPRWQGGGDSGGILVYRNTAAEGWSVLRVDSMGSIRARATVAGPTGQTPGVTDIDGDLVLVLPSGELRPLEWTPRPTIP